jgi:hypothetical protein
LQQKVQWCIRGTVREHLGVENSRTSKESAIDVFAVALLVFAVVFLVGVLCFGLATLPQIHGGQRERLQMMKHIRTWYVNP